MIERVEQDGLTLLRLAHGKVNALDLELCRALDQELRALESNSTRAVLLTGAGRAFCAGVDLVRMLNEGPAYIAEFLPALRNALTRLTFFPKPIVGAANGHAIAGGCILLAACDRRLMCGGKIGVPELRVGVPFPRIALEIVRATTNPSRLQEVLFLGGTYTATEATALGWVDEVVPAADLEPRALECARNLAEIPSEAYAVAKRQLRAPIAAALLEQDPEDEARIDAWWRSAEAAEAIRRYLATTLGQGGSSRDSA